MKTKRVFFTSLAAFILSFHMIYAQDAPEKSFMVYPTIGFGIGFFYPQDVNDYIKNDLSSMGYSAVNEDMYMYLEIKAGVAFRLQKVDFNLSLEYDLGPKLVVGGEETYTYGFNRVSPELSFNYYIPNKTGKNAFFIGAGIHYSFMSFEEFSGSAPGFKAQIGYSLQFGKFNLQPYGAFRYAKSTDTSEDFGNDFVLDYTGGQIGVLLSFHQRMLYK
jgi:hypothetical protein